MTLDRVGCRVGALSRGMGLESTPHWKSCDGDVCLEVMVRVWR